MMKKFKLNELPIPPRGKKGWPWTKESSDFSKCPPNSLEWPKVSIVTPSYNQGNFIEETIRSVLLQNYPNLEYIIIDGGSADGAVEIIKKYEPWIAYWVNEQDKGQSDAINKGFAKSTGKIMAWLNSDDLLTPNSLFECALQLDSNIPDWITSSTKVIDEQSNIKYIQKVTEITEKTFYSYQINWIPQPSTFWTRPMWDEAGSLNTELHYVMDVDLWFRMLQISAPSIHPLPLSCYREHSCAKSISEADQSLDEYVEWFCRDVLGVSCIAKGRIKMDFRDLIKENITVHNKIQHLENHIFLGNILKFWRRYINPRLA